MRCRMFALLLASTLSSVAPAASQQQLDAVASHMGVRVAILESQPFHRGTQEYRIVDPAVGQLERGHVRVADLIVRQPTDDDLPLIVTSRTGLQPTG